ncbi:hypothetical protein [Desulfosporosinus sp. SB140]|uniref:hypothetical protein n=1 Tax=Desulfosporosinus paludis TaxID=3115649 RepID=UPI00388FC0A3
MITKTFIEIVIMIPTTLAAGFLLAVSGVIQKVMNDLDEVSFKYFLTRLEYRAMRSPFAMSVSLISSIAAIPYWIIYGFNNWWYTAGLVMWFVAAIASKILNMPIYKKIKELTNSQTEELKNERRKLQTANNIRAWLTFISVILMVISFI